MRIYTLVVLLFAFATNTAIAGHCNNGHEKMSEVQTYESTEKKVKSNTTSKNMMASEDEVNKKQSNKAQTKHDTYGY